MVGRVWWSFALVALAGCKGGGHPAAVPDASATSGTSTTNGPGALSTSVDNPKLDTCDDLGILPCARQVNRVLLPIAGSSLQLVYSSDRQPGRKVDAAPAAAPVGFGGWSISDLPGYDPATKSEILPDGTVRKVTGSSIGTAFAVVDPAGATATEFDKQGRATATVDAVTGATVATFTWTAAGLATVTDGSDATLTIGRDKAGNPTSISVTGTSPMTLTSPSGELTGVFYPNGNNVQLSVGSNGLLGSITDWNDLTTTYTYDPRRSPWRALRSNRRRHPLRPHRRNEHRDGHHVESLGDDDERQCRPGQRHDHLHAPRCRRRHQHRGGRGHDSHGHQRRCDHQDHPGRRSSVGR